MRATQSFAALMGACLLVGGCVPALQVPEQQRRAHDQWVAATAELPGVDSAKWETHKGGKGQISEKAYVALSGDVDYSHAAALSKVACDHSFESTTFFYRPSSGREASTFSRFGECIEEATFEQLVAASRALVADVDVTVFPRGIDLSAQTVEDLSAVLDELARQSDHLDIHVTARLHDFAGPKTSPAPDSGYRLLSDVEMHVARGAYADYAALAPAVEEALRLQLPDLLIEGRTLTVHLWQRDVDLTSLHRVCGPNCVIEDGHRIS